MIKMIKKRVAIRSYRSKIGPWLQRRYGGRANYTPLQVRNCALSTGVNLDYICYAYAMYCSRDDFNAHHAATGETCNYDTMQAEIGVGTPVSGSNHSFGSDRDGGWSDSSDNSADSGGGEAAVVMAETRASGPLPGASEAEFKASAREQGRGEGQNEMPANPALHRTAGAAGERHLAR